MQIGDRIFADGYSGTIVALLKEKIFHHNYSPADWGYLETGMLVMDDQAGLIHYSNLAGVRIEPLND